jgi:hypothetical protein
MADIYLRSSDGSDSDNGSTWALAKATLAAAITAAGNGGRVFVSDTHSESTAGAITLACPALGSNQVLVLCVDDAGNPEPPTALTTGAIVAVTGNTNNINFTGHGYFYGIDFRAGNSTNANDINVLSASGSTGEIIFENCQLKLVGTNSGSDIIFGGGTAANSQRVELRNTPLTHSNVGNRTIPRCEVIWKNTPSAIAGLLPTTLFTSVTSGQGKLLLEGVDLSALGSGKTLFAVSDPPLVWMMRDCKLGAGVTITNGSFTAPGPAESLVINCDDDDTNYVFNRQNYLATETHETTIVRTSGASDGTTPVSRKIVTNAVTRVQRPYESLPIEVWNETIGSAVTISIPVITDGVTLTDAEAWIEVEGLTTSGVPLGSHTTDRIANLSIGSASNQPTDGTSTWTTTGLSSPVKQTLSASVTLREKGLIRVRVCVAKASTTVYYDPLAQVA